MIKIEFKKLFREWFSVAFPVGFIFLIMLVFLLMLKNTLVFFICTASYVLPTILLVFFVWKYGSKDIFLDIYEKLTNPIAGLILLSFLFLLFYYTFSLGVGVLSLMGVVFFLAFLIAFFGIASLSYLRREKHPYLTVRAIYTTKKYLKWNAVSFVLFVIISFITLDISFKNSYLFPISIYSTILAYYFFFSTFGMFGLNFLLYDDTQKFCKIGLKIVKEGLNPPRQVGKLWVEKRLSVFQTVIDQFSGLAKKFYPGSPRISESYTHRKALWAAHYAGHHASDYPLRENLLKNAKEGIGRMNNSLEAGKSKGFDFYLFISGLILIDREKGQRILKRSFMKFNKRLKYLVLVIKQKDTGG